MRRKAIISIVSIFCLVSVLLGPQMVKGAGLPKTVYWGARSIGSGLHGVSVALTEALAKEMGIKFRLVPGTSTEQVYMMKSGRIDVYATGGGNWFEPMGLAQCLTLSLGPQPSRILWAGLPKYAGGTALATKTSGIKVPSDLKGKRVALIPGVAFSEGGLNGTLAFANLTRDDVKIVKVSSWGAAYKAMAQGKVDYTFGNNISSGIIEADTSPYGIRIIKLDYSDDAAWKRLQKHMPLLFRDYITEGVGVKPGEKVEGAKYGWPQIGVIKSTPDDLVYALCDGIYKVIDKAAENYKPLQAMLGMKKKGGLGKKAVVNAPFHRAAVKFFKDKGIWSPELEWANQKKLDQTRRAKKRWDQYMIEVEDRAKKEKINLKKEWTKIVHEEIGVMPW